MHYSYIDEPDALAHYGVLGMKWGVRKDGKPQGYQYKRSYTGKTKTGHSFQLKEAKKPRISRGLYRISSKTRNAMDRTYDYNAYSGDKKIGNIQLYLKPSNEMNITWAQVEKPYRNLGYLQGMLTIGEQIARDNGATKITGETIGSSPDALAATQRKGYKIVGEDKTKEVLEIWGGLTFVEKDLKINPEQKTLTDRFDDALKDNPKLTYAKIYKDMKVNTNSEDPDVYKQAEDAWLKKHGY